MQPKDNLGIESSSNRLSRRDFVRSTTIAGAAVSLGHSAMPFAFGQSGDSTSGLPAANPSWADKPMRWAQLTLVENDPQDFDLEFWLDYFKRTHSDAVCLSGGGCVAYYPTEIPYHHRSRWLGDQDVLGDLVKGCRELGMVVIVRTDPHATYDDVKAAHPDWIAVTEDGQARRHWASPEMWVTCGLGPYNFEFMTEVKREVMKRYRVDGVFINRWNGSGMCYCQHCQANFKKASGHELPHTRDRRDPVARSYFLWWQQRLFDLWRTWDAAIREINPDSCVIPNMGGGASSRLGMKQIGELAPTLMADRQGRRGLMAPWANGMNAKEFRAGMGNKPIVGIFSVGNVEKYRWKDSVQHGDEIRLWVADTVANGMRPWFTKFAGSINDPRWLKPVEEIYNWCHRHETYLRNEKPLARVGLVYSQQTSWFYKGERSNDEVVSDPIDGWYQALIEARVPFEMVHDRLLDADNLKAYKTLILPNIACLSDKQGDQLRAFVKGGGGIAATYETSLFDENGNARKDFGLADLFGVSFKDREKPMQNAYLGLEHETAKGHSMLKGLEDAPRIIHGVNRLNVIPKAKFENPPVTLIPPYPDLPMEKVFARIPRTDTAEVYLREFGRGRVVFFPWDIDRTFWEVLSVDHYKLLRNSVHWATNEEQPVTVSGPGVLDVTIWRQKKSMTIHLVNLTNPMMMKGPVRELIPITKQHVRFRLPEGTRPARVRLLDRGTSPFYEQKGEWIELTVPSIRAHEVVAVDLTSA